MPSLANKLKGVKLPAAPEVPLWLGPCDPGERGGLTQSMIQKFLVCRERFRITYVEGLQTFETFRMALEYGNLWHACEEAWALGQDWEKALTAYTQKLVAQYRTQQEQVVQAHHVCRTQFPIYIEFWAKHKAMQKREQVSAEHKFHVPYTLPSGRVVWLRGKMDSVDIVTHQRKRKTWLQENKAQGTPDEADIKSQLYCDLQSMMYLVALREDPLFAETLAKAPLEGIRYNVIRRPLAGGKHSIRQHQPSKAKPGGETKEEFYDRLGSLIREDAAFFFMRWNAVVPAGDLVRFENRTLIPILEQICDWYEHIAECVKHGWNPFTTSYTHRLDIDESGNDQLTTESYVHWQHPFGVYNIVNEGGRSDVDEYLQSGSESGLARTKILFPELQ